VQSETTGISIDDAVLVKKAGRGDPEAAERLILKYQNRIYNAILKICANTDDAAELTQETFVKIIENLDKFEGRSSFYTWAFRIAVNLTLNHCRRDGKLAIRSLDDDAEYNEQTKQVLKDLLADDKSPDPAAVVQNKELCAIVIGAMMKLDEAHRAVIVLRDIEGMNYAQIAEVLDIKLGTVRSRLSRARSNLREIMETFLR
jgi:RNA polymerase sigma-70 factor (ECF subfamily)